MRAKTGDLVVLAAPSEINEIMKKVPKGSLNTINEIFKRLAKKHNVKFCCTLTTGIFIMISANAAEEDKIMSIKRITPYWRTLKMNGFLNDKFPREVKNKKKLLEDEDFKIIQKGKRFFVNNYKDYLVK